MKKTLIAAAVLMSIAGAAQAQLSIYGLLDASYGKSILDDLNGDKATFHSGGDNGSSNGNSTSRVGIKGTTELAPGLKANFKLETGGITSDGEVNPGGAFFNRQAWLGASGGFGELRLGRQDSIPFQVMIDLDFNGASNGVSAGAYTGIGVFNTGRQSRSLQYISPDFGGAMVHLGYAAKDQDANTNAKDVFSAGAKWTGGPLVIAGSYEGKRTENAHDFMSLGATFDLSFVKLMAGYTDAGSIDNGGAGKGYSFGAVAPLMGFNVGAIFAKNSDDRADAKAYEIFVNKEIYKNTYAYAEYGNLKASPDGGEGSVNVKAKGFAVGVIFTF